MPLYDYRCDACGVQTECLLPMEHEAPKCPKCEGEMCRFFTQGATFHQFREGWYEHIDAKPIYVSSKKQLREETRSRGLTSEYAED